MRDRFSQKLREGHSLYCSTCRRVEQHDLFIPQSISSTQQFNPEQPILCNCQRCTNGQVYFAREFRKFGPEPSVDSLCKVFGRNRLLVRDWVYAPGWARPGQVKSRFRTQNTETFVITWQDGQESELRQPCQDSENLSAEGFRLLPYQASICSLGDTIYHVNRESTGVVQGFQFSKDSRIVVQMEDKTMLLMTVPEVSIYDNYTLAQKAQEVLSRELGSEALNIKIKTGQGIIYLTGYLSALPHRNLVQSALAKISQCRGFVDMLAVQPTILVADEDLEQQAHDALLDCKIPVFGLQITCEFGCLTVNGYVRHPDATKDIYQRLQHLQGLHNLVLHLRLRPTENSAERQRKLKVTKALQSSSSLSNVRIRVASVDDTIYLEGSVLSSLQKNTATITAMWGCRGLRVENNLKIIRKNLGNSFIHSV